MIRLTPAQAERLLALRRAGTTHGVLAQRFGISQSMVHRLCKAHGLASTNCRTRGRGGAS
ncbi:transposase family protein [Novosphingobium sp. FKTRR1]|uniref:transposase family protein n=1 Tax=Novosphingobium sp. FKTRR1 TaxID=2879118 RepID=UPI001CF069A8|nr:transposase family protein [Novosphingobium sp. FKTRR1]